MSATHSRVKNGFVLWVRKSWFDSRDDCFFDLLQRAGHARPSRPAVTAATEALGDGGHIDIGDLRTG